MQVQFGVFEAFKMPPAAFIAVICLCRACAMDNRVRRFIMWTYVCLSMSAAGIVMSFLLEPWVRHLCVVGFLIAIACLLIDGEQRWRKDIPEELLKATERWPYKNRRLGPRGRRVDDLDDPPDEPGGQ